VDFGEQAGRTNFVKCVSLSSIFVFVFVLSRDHGVQFLLYVHMFCNIRQSTINMSNAIKVYPCSDLTNRHV